MRRAITNVRALIGDALIDEVTVLINDGNIEDVGQVAVPTGVPCIDGRGLLALPGIVDIHGDAVERTLAPRPTSTFSVAMALVENDRAMLASGTTTAFLSLTDSPEPGLRSRATLRAVVDALRHDDLPLASDTRVHVRHETLQTQHHDELCQWLTAGDVGMVSLNDHYPEHDDVELRRHAISLRWRIAAPIEEIEAVLREAWQRRDDGENQLLDPTDVCAQNKLVSSGPARLAGLEGRKGTLHEGADADLLLVDETTPPMSIRPTAPSPASSTTFPARFPSTLPRSARRRRRWSHHLRSRLPSNESGLTAPGTGWSCRAHGSLT